MMESAIETKKAALTTQASVPRVAIVGAGYWGKNLVRNFAELGGLAAIVDPDQATVQKLSSLHGIPAATFDDVLHDPTVAGVAISAPAALHFKLAKAALDAGKHVFVEKPLALNIAEAQLLVALAEQHDRRLMVGHLLQYHPAFLRLLKLVREGQLGRLQYLYSNRLNIGKIRREEDILWSFAPHDVSMILSLVGQEPDGVSALGSCYLHQHIADVTTTHLTFAGGERAHIFVSWLHPVKEQKLVVVGTDGMVVFDDCEPWERKLVRFPHRIDWKDGVPVANQASGIPVPLTAGEPLRAECQHFLDCIATGATPRTDGREGLRVLTVLSRATAAMRHHQSSQGAVSPERSAPRFPNVRIHESAVVDDGVEIGASTSIWHFSHILPGVTIGEHCSIGQNVMIGPDVTVGERCKIQNNVSIYKGVVLEDGVFCGPSCVFTNVNNPRAEVERKSEYRPTIVRRGGTIGANATIVCGHELGEYCFIAAGSVVTKDVPAYALMAGVPARRIGWMSRHGEKLGPDLVCPATGQKYRLVNPSKLEEVCE